MTNEKIKVIGAWILSVALAVSFAPAGLQKVIQHPNVIASFERFGYSASFAVLIGLLEGFGGLFVLVPGLAFYGAASIAVVMIGATYTHLSTGIGSPTMALFALAVAALLLWLRFSSAYWMKDQISKKSEA